MIVPVALALAGLSAESVCQHTLEQAYNGATDSSLARFSALGSSETAPLCAYAELLVRVSKLEQTPPNVADDEDFLRRASELAERAQLRLRLAPEDDEARFVRGAAIGLASRLHLSRWQRRPAARTAAQMRAELSQVKVDAALFGDAQFGLGLYDYYADVLPRVLKLLRFLTGLPGGDRERGLRAIQAAKARAVWHRTEAQAQLFDIYSYFEDRQDDALAEIEDLRERYPDSPLWGLRLADHQRERLGLYSESATTARALLAAAEGGHPNHARVIAALARVQLAEALLLDWRPGEARAALPSGALRAELQPVWVGRAEWVLGRSLELERRRPEALAHYKVVAACGTPDVEARGEQALREPVMEVLLQAWPHLAAGRRATEQARLAESRDAFRRALELCKDCPEAILRVAEADLDLGRLGGAVERLPQLAAAKAVAPPWVGPWASLLLARRDDLAGRRELALRQYKEVLQRPLGSRALGEQARLGLSRPFRPAGAQGGPAGTANHSR